MLRLCVGVGVDSCTRRHLQNIRHHLFSGLHEDAVACSDNAYVYRSPACHHSASAASVHCDHAVEHMPVATTTDQLIGRPTRRSTRLLSMRSGPASTVANVTLACTDANQSLRECRLTCSSSTYCPGGEKPHSIWSSKSVASCRFLERAAGRASGPALMAAVAFLYEQLRASGPAGNTSSRRCINKSNRFVGV